MTPTQPTATTTEVSEAAKALVEKLHLIHADPTFQSVWTLSHLRCGPYTGPQYDKELAALEAALSTAPSGPTDAVVPREPTEAMLKAGGGYVANMVGDPYNSWSHFTIEAKAIWDAMLSAALSQRGTDE